MLPGIEINIVSKCDDTNCMLLMNHLLQVILLDPDNGYFKVGCIYGRNDDADRFHFFSGIAMEYLSLSGENPDIIHCHDWPTAPGIFLDGPGRKVCAI